MKECTGIRFQMHHSVTNLVIPVRNRKFNLTREVLSTASPKNVMIEEDFDYDSLASVSSERTGNFG